MRPQKSLVQFMTRLHSLSLLLHLLALGMWLGGIAFFLIVFGPAVHELKPLLGLKLLNRGRISFEALSWTAIGLLFLTGILNLAMRSDMTAGDVGQYYLTILSVKLLLFVAMLVHHTLQVFKYGPKIAVLTNDAATTVDSWPEPLRMHWQKWFMFLKINATIGPIATLLGLALVRR
jgi:putative copper export protein